MKVGDQLHVLAILPPEEGTWRRIGRRLVVTPRAFMDMEATGKKMYAAAGT
jgi:hypothetical protein